MIDKKPESADAVSVNSTIAIVESNSYEICKKDDLPKTHSMKCSKLDCKVDSNVLKHMKKDGSLARNCLMTALF